MLLLLGFTLIFIFGYFLSIVLVERMHLLERLGISYLLGLGIMTLLMFCYSTLGIKITLNSTLIALVILVLVVFLLSKIFKREISLDLSKLLTPIIEASTFEKVMVVIIAGLGIASLVITTYFPVYIWDALAIYDFRGKIIAHEGFYTQIASNYFWFKGYPLFTSLSHTLVYLFGGINPKRSEERIIKVKSLQLDDLFAIITNCTLLLRIMRGGKKCQKIQEWKK